MRSIIEVFAPVTGDGFWEAIGFGDLEGLVGLEFQGEDGLAGECPVEAVGGEVHEVEVADVEGLARVRGKDPFDGHLGLVEEEPLHLTPALSYDRRGSDQLNTTNGYSCPISLNHRISGSASL